ncbi:glycosyltransferase family A protein [Leifsonella bigeumensis]|uniref:glycosyltransferase family A protein n=1 Tax=Leifsonella bigeumensis TaxID=433643 RepID=UPI0031E08AF8
MAILTFNGEKHIGDILSALEVQQYDGEFDVLVIDSGSSDHTLEIIASHPSVRLHEIPNAEFGHGRTRNLAARLATGDIVVYLTHDAVPLGVRWLEAMVAPFNHDEVAAVLGRQVARASAPPLLKYDIDRVFQRQGRAGDVTLHRADGAGTESPIRRIATFYSDSAAAARRKILLGPIPYSDVAYAEDQVFGRAVIDAGLTKAYAGNATVEHSNDGTLREFGERIAADLIGLRSIGTEVPTVSRFVAFRQWVKWSIVDTGRILVDPGYGLGRSLYWLVMNPIYHAVKWSSYRRASLQPLNPAVPDEA